MRRSARVHLGYVMILAILALVFITAVPQAGGQQPATVARIGVLPPSVILRADRLIE